VFGIIIHIKTFNTNYTAFLFVSGIEH